MELNILLYLAIILVSGLVFGRLAKLVRLPNVTGYLVAGLVIGPCVLGVIPDTIVSDLSLISEMALAFIAFTIGLTFKRSYFKRVGMMPVVIAVFEAMMAVFLVQGALIAFGFDIRFSIVLGAIAAATAPAATILIIKQYRAVFTSKKGAPEGFIPYTGYDVASSCGYISSYFRSFGPRGAQVRPLTNPKAKNCSGVLYTTQTEVESSNSVLCTITRGFRHQIRVHMAWAGYPLAGDTLYGGDEADVFGLEAVSLTFANPSDGQVLTITL